MAKTDKPHKKPEQKRLLTEVLGKSTAPDPNKPATQRGNTGSPPGKKLKDLQAAAVTPMDVDTELPTELHEQPLDDEEPPPTDAGKATSTTLPPDAPSNSLPKDDIPSTPTYADAAARAPETVAPDSTKQPAGTKLASVFHSSMTRKNALFIKVMFPYDANPKDPVKTARTQLMEYFQMLTSVDAATVLYKWNKDKDLGSDACLKPSALPTTLTGIQSYADQFRPVKEGGDCWCTLRVGFNKEPEEFMAELRAQATVRKWVAKKQSLQTAYTEIVGWFLYLPQATDVDFWTAQINGWIKNKIAREAGTPPLVIGLDHRAIFDGLSREAQKKMSKDERWAKRAVHVICKRGEKTRATAILRAFLRSSLFNYLCNVPSKLIPPLPFGHSGIFQGKYQEATLKHMKLAHFGTASLTTFAFTGLDKKTNFLADKPSLRDLILGIKARGTDKDLFLAVNPATKAHEKGGYVITYLSKFETEAVEKITNLAAYLKHLYGEEALERFSQEAIDQAEQTIWDTTEDRPITVEEQFLDDIVGEDIDWVENLNDVHFERNTETTIIIDRPKKRVTFQPEYPVTADADSIATFHPGQRISPTTDNDSNADDGSGTARSNPEAFDAEASAGSSAGGA